jgi:hypothetical protein
MENVILKENVYIELRGTAVTDKGVVVLQKCLDLPEVMPGSYSDTCLSSHDGNDVVSIKVEEVLHIKEEENSVPVSSPVIKDEHEVRCMVVSLLNHFTDIENWLLSFSLPFVYQHETNPHWPLVMKCPF